MKFTKLLSIVVAVLMISVSVFSCADSNESSSSKESGSDTGTNEVTTDGDNSNNVPNNSPLKPIISKLNRYDSDNEIIITESEDKKSVNLKITWADSGTDVFNQNISIDDGYKVTYYLIDGKDNNPDSLLYFGYNYMESNTKLVIEAKVFYFTTDGIYENSFGKKLFNIGPNDSLGSHNIVFQSILSQINENLGSSLTTEAFILVDNQTDKIVYSTSENMIPAPKLTLTLENFIKQ
jgi:hypothetical protein